jgi:hypothetical protein
MIYKHRELSRSIELIIQAIPVYLIISRGGKIEKATRARKTVNLVVYLRREGLFSWTVTSSEFHYDSWIW